MSLQSHFEFLFVGRDEGSFLENYSYDLTEEHGIKGGKLFVTLEIQNNPTDAEVIGETVADSIRRAFFADIESEPYDRLEASLKAANGVIKRFTEQRVSKFIGNINVVVGAICGNELYLSQAGDAEAYLVRSKYVSVLTEGLNEDCADDSPFVNIASGTLEKGDFLLFSTAKLLRFATQSEFVKCLSSRNVSSSLSKLRDLLETEILTKIAVVGIGVFGREGPSNLDTKNVEVHEEVMRSGVNLEPEPLVGKKVGFSDVKARFSGAITRASGTVKNIVNKGVKVPKTSKDKLLVGLIVVILVLTFGIWYAKNEKQSADEIVRLDKVLNEVSVLVSDAETRGYDKKVANELLKQAEQKVIEVRNSGQHRNRSNEMLEKINSIKATLDNIVVFSNPEKYVVADLTSKRPNVSALGLIGTDDVVYVYEYNALYEVIAGQLQDPKTIDGNETVVAGGEFEDRKSLVFLTKSGKVIEYNNDQFQFADSKDGAFHKGVAIDDWSNKIYVLDADNKQVWKYPYSGRSEVFSKPDAYIQEGDITGAVDLAIDKSVYVLKSNGEIIQYLGGEVQDFSIKKGPIDPLEKPTKIYTEDELSELFVLEPEKSRVLVFHKDEKNGGMIYQSQFVIENSDDLRDIYFDKDDRRLYVLSATKLYQFEL